MGSFRNADGKPVLLKMVRAIQDSKAYLGEVDGLIGDGDHGMNMNKGFTRFGERIAGREISFTKGLDKLGTLLFTEIGGSMGPIYGTVFTAMAEAGQNMEELGVEELAVLLEAGLNSLYDIVDARVGDKTLVDTMSPARDALRRAADGGRDLTTALREMKGSAETGRDSTKDMIARFGRSSRLGERSRGVLDAGAASCCVILTAIADGILEQLDAVQEDPQTQTIVIGCDNAAVGMKDALVEFLKDKDIAVEDMGCDSAGDPTNYPTVAKRVCERIIESGYKKRGILVCGTGIGMSMTANKFRGIRSAVCHDNFSAERSILSNNGNVLCLGERVIGYELAKKIVGEWISLRYKDGPSTPKVQEILDIEAQNMR